MLGRVTTFPGMSGPAGSFPPRRSTSQSRRMPVSAAHIGSRPNDGRVFERLSQETPATGTQREPAGVGPPVPTAIAVGQADASRGMLRIDHATLAASSLERLEDAFAAAGLPTAYGGMHSNGVTEMSLLGFRDGSYVECISTAEPDVESPLWDTHIRNDGGPCAWAVRAEDITAEATRLRDAGITVSGPEPMARERPDGVELAWELAVPGEGEPGATLPFFIADETPREWRVSPTPAAADSELTGIERVVLGVGDADRAAERFRRAFPDLPEPVREAGEPFGATLVQFPGSPPVLAEPAAGSWLAERLEQLGPSPCGLLLGTTDVERSAERFGLDARASWEGREVGWPTGPEGKLSEVGVVEVGENSR